MRRAWLVVTMANEQNLVPITSRTSSELRAQTSKGGKKSGEVRRRKRDMSQLVQTMLDQQLSGKQAQALAKQFPDLDDDATFAAQMVAGQIKAAAKGNTKAFVALSDHAERAASKSEKRQAWHIDPIDLTVDFIEPYRLARRVLDGKETDVRQVIHKGGRGGAKSSFWAEFAYETMRSRKLANVVFTRRYSSDREHTIFEQFCRIIAKHKDGDNWTVTKAPMRCTYKPHGTSVYFFGSDNPLSNKSFTPQVGYVALLIHEECDEMAGVSQMDDAENTYLRANGVEQANALDVKIFNPPASRSNFMNRYVEEMRGDSSCAIFDACYLNVPREWLGERFFERAEWFKANKPEIYRNKFLGEVTGTGGELFDNVTEREITAEEWTQLNESGKVWQGCDFGYEHPMAFMRVAFDRDTDTLYILDEHVQRHAKLADFLARPEREGWIDAEVICDSAEPDRIAEMREWGWQAVKAVKRWAGNKGRAYAWDWLRQRREIVVDPDRCPNMARELRVLEFERLRDGEYSSRYPDLGEDCVMATIYALNREIMAASEYDF